MKTMYRKTLEFLSAPALAGSLSAAIQQFLLFRVEEVSQATMVHLYRSLSAFATDVGGGLPVAELTAGDFVAYADHLRSRYSPGTIGPVVGDLKQFASWLHQEGITASNYGRRLVKPRAVKEKHHAEEADMLTLIRRLAGNLDGLLQRDLFGALRAADDGWNYESLKTLHDLTAVMLLYESGCRAGELCNLSSHRLNKAFAQPAPAYSIVAYGKTNDRTYHVTESTVELYRLWYAKRPFSMTWAFCSWRRGGEPEKLSAPALGQMLARRCHQAGIRPFRPHSMRHAKVIRSRKLVGLELASRLVDHANIQTTRAYDFIDDGEVGVAARLTGYSGKLW